MSYQGHIGLTDPAWLEALFSPPEGSGGISRCSASEVHEKIGRMQLEREVRQRGFRMVQAGDQVLIVCRAVPVRLLV